MTISRDRRPCLVMMVKDPVAGRVKTRLGRDIGMTAAAWWFRHQTRVMIRRLRDPRWRLILAVSPDNQAPSSRFWPMNLPRLPQGKGTLGTRMKHIFNALPPGPVLIIGADIPGIGKRHIISALRVLGSHDAVIGPAPDGGYWLIGLKRRRTPPPALFDGVRWSSENALIDTVSTLKDHRIAYIETLRDVDTAADL